MKLPLLWKYEIQMFELLARLEGQLKEGRCVATNKTPNPQRTHSFLTK
jgi:hypothetical protein